MSDKALDDRTQYFPQIVTLSLLSPYFTFLEVFQHQLQVAQRLGILLTLVLYAGHLHVGRVSLTRHLLELLLQRLDLPGCLVAAGTHKTKAILECTHTII